MSHRASKRRAKTRIENGVRVNIATGDNAKSRIVNGQRVDTNTGQPFAQPNQSSSPQNQALGQTLGNLGNTLNQFGNGQATPQGNFQQISNTLQQLSSRLQQLQGGGGLLPSQGTGSAPFQVPIPKNVAQDSLTPRTTTADVLNKRSNFQSQFDRFFQQQQDLQQQTIQALQPTEQELATIEEANTIGKEETDRQTKLLRDIEKVQTRAGSTKGNIDIETANLRREANRELADIALRRQEVTSRLQTFIDQRALNRDGAKLQLEFNQQNFQAFQSLQKLTRPDVLNTQVNRETGEVFAIIQDPQTGEVFQQSLGNIGAEAQKPFIQTGTYTNEATGERFFYGVGQDGTITSQPLPQSAGLKASPDEALNTQIKQAQLANIYSQIAERNPDGSVLIDPSSKVVLKPKEARKLNKELVGNDAFKVIRKGQDSLQFLLDFEKSFDKFGLETIPGKAKGELASKYQTTILNLKEFFNLGVLNGPDLEVLQGIMPSPVVFPKLLGFIPLSKKLSGVKSATRAGIDSLKQNMEKTLDDRYSSLMSQYGDYSTQSLSSLGDLQRIYVNQKASLNPKIANMIRENPELSFEDIISIITE